MGKRKFDSDDPFRPGQTSDGRAICGAKAKGTGRPCRKPPEPGRTRCRMHGGATPIGPAHPRWRHGGFSEFLPLRLVPAYERFADDPDLGTLHHEIAVLTARETDLMSQFDNGEGGPLWPRLGKEWQAYERALSAKDTDGMAKALRRIGETIARGNQEHAAWRELVAVMEAKRRLIETEIRRVAASQDVLTPEQAMVMVAGLIDMFRSRVADRKLLAEFSVDIRRLFGAPNVIVQEG